MKNNKLVTFLINIKISILFPTSVLIITYSVRLGYNMNRAFFSSIFAP